MRHFEVTKTLDILSEHLFWLCMRKMIQQFCDKSLARRKAKSLVQPHGSYTTLPILEMPWVDISMDFVLRLPKTSKGRDFIFVVVDHFFKMAHFIPCNEVDHLCYIVNIFFKEVVQLHGLHRSIVFDNDSKFLNHCWRTL